MHLPILTPKVYDPLPCTIQTHKRSTYYTHALESIYINKMLKLLMGTSMVIENPQSNKKNVQIVK